MRRKLLGTITAALLVAGGVGIAAPAYASPQQYCPSGATCTWGDRYYLTSGIASARIWFQQCVENYSGLGYPGTSVPGDNTATSIFNNGLYETSYMYAGANGASYIFALAPGYGYDQLNAQLPAGNDSISSAFFKSFNTTHTC